MWYSLHKHVILCADLQSGQQHLPEGNMQQAHAAQLRELQAAHEQQVRSIQQAAQQSQADLQAAHAVESRIMQEAHAADMKQLQELREALPEALAQASSEARHPQDLSTSEIGTFQQSDLCAVQENNQSTGQLLTVLEACLVCQLITCASGSWQTRGASIRPEAHQQSHSVQFTYILTFDHNYHPKLCLSLKHCLPSSAWTVSCCYSQYGSQLISIARDVIILNQTHFLTADMAYGKTCTAAAYLLANLQQLSKRGFDGFYSPDYSPGLGADALLAERGEVAVSCEELNELRVLAANGAD